MSFTPSLSFTHFDSTPPHSVIIVYTLLIALLLTHLHFMELLKLYHIHTHRNFTTFILIEALPHSLIEALPHSYSLKLYHIHTHQNFTTFILIKTLLHSYSLKLYHIHTHFLLILFHFHWNYVFPIWKAYCFRSITLFERICLEVFLSQINTSSKI